MHNQRGILHKLMLFLILALGFGLALTLPAFKRHQDEKHAHQTLQLMQHIAHAEQDFYARNGFYTADFAQWANQKKCQEEVKEGHSVLACAGYDIGLEEANVLRASSTKYPQWFKVELESGKISCGYEEEAVVGQYLCRAVHL